jgi:hypothetical protein
MYILSHPAPLFHPILRAKDNTMPDLRCRVAGYLNQTRQGVTMDRAKEILNEILIQDRLIGKIYNLFPRDVEIVEKYVDNLISARRIGMLESRAHVAVEELETIPR